jgi:hypothetical protein
LHKRRAVAINVAENGKPRAGQQEQRFFIFLPVAMSATGSTVSREPT